jgi:hypothetical protein
MELRRLRISDWIAGGSALALLGLMFLDWFGAEARETERAIVRGEADRSAWQAFGALDLALVLAALMALALVVLTATQRTPAIPIAWASVTALVALIATVWLVARAAWPPDAEGTNLETTRETGLWLGLLAAAGIAGGGLASMRDESPGLREPSPWEAPDRAPSVPATTLPPPEPAREPRSGQ